MAQLEIRLLGTPQFLRDSTPITDFIPNKVPALLVYLAITRHAHSRDKLASLPWGSTVGKNFIKGRNISKLTNTENQLDRFNTS